MGDGDGRRAASLARAMEGSEAVPVRSESGGTGCDEHRDAEVHFVRASKKIGEAAELGRCSDKPQLRQPVEITVHADGRILEPGAHLVRR